MVDQANGKDDRTVRRVRHTPGGEPMERLHDALARMASLTENLQNHLGTALTRLPDGRPEARSSLDRERRPLVDGGTGGDRLLTLAEVAALTGRHPELLRRWCAAGRISGQRIGRTWLMRRGDVEALAEIESRARRREPDGERRANAREAGGAVVDQGARLDRVGQT